MRTPSLTMENAFDGMPIIVLPDDDERLKDVEPGCIGSDGFRLYVSETLWKRVKPMLVAEAANASNERTPLCGGPLD